MAKWAPLPLSALCILALSASTIRYYASNSIFFSFVGDRSTPIAARQGDDGRSGLVPIGDDPIHVLITVCNGGNNDLEVRSMLRYREAVDLLITIQRYGMGKPSSSKCSTTRNGRHGGGDGDGGPGCERIIVHVFADDVETLSREFLEISPTSELIDRLDVRLRAMPRPDTSEGQDYDKFRTCASARLYATHLFEASSSSDNAMTETEMQMPERVIYLDTDTLVTTRLRGLWETSRSAFDERPDALFAMGPVCALVPEMGPHFYTGYVGENATGVDGVTRLVYTVPKGTCAGYNSGVLFADLRRWRRDNFTGMVSEQESHARRMGYVMPFGDNGILNAMVARFPERMVELPCYWNAIIDSLQTCFRNYSQNGGGILHVQYKNRGKYHDERSPATALHDYLVRTANDTVDFLARSEAYDQGDGDNKIFSTILRQMIGNETDSLR